MKHFSPPWVVPNPNYIRWCLIAEPLGEAGNRGARSRNAFVCMYVCMYVCIYIYIYISVPVNYCHLDRLRNRQDGAPDLKPFGTAKTGADRQVHQANYTIRILLHSQPFGSACCPQTS